MFLLKIRPCTAHTPCVLRSRFLEGILDVKQYRRDPIFYRGAGYYGLSHVRHTPPHQSIDASVSPSQHVVHQHGSHPPMEGCPGAECFRESLPGSAIAPAGFTNVVLPCKGECHPPSQTAALGPATPAHVEQWSPATERSTPPFDAHPVSPTPLPSLRGVYGAAAAIDSTAEVQELQAPGHTTPGRSRRTLLQLRQVFGFKVRRTSSMRIFPIESPAHSWTNRGGAIVESVAPSSAHTLSARVEPSNASPSSSHDSNLRGPLSNELRCRSPVDDGSGYAKRDIEDENPSASAPAATKRTAMEGDLEEGGVRATAADVSPDGDAEAISSVSMPSAPVAATAAVSPRVATVVVADPAVVEQGIVLPCAPSDEEKVRRRHLDFAGCIWIFKVFVRWQLTM